MGGLGGIVGVSDSHPIPSSIPAPPSLKPDQNNRGGPRCLSLLKPRPLINRLRGDPACLLYLREKGFWIEKSLLGQCVCVCRNWQVFGSILSCHILVTGPCCWDYWTGQGEEETISQAYRVHCRVHYTAEKHFEVHH